MWDEHTKDLMKEDFCNGIYSSIDDLGVAYKVPHDTIWKWVREGHWREARLMVTEDRQKKMIARVGDNLSEIDEKHYKGFEAIFSLLMKRIQLYQKSIKEEEAAGKTPLISTGDLASFAQTMDKIQKGQRVAAGLDSDEDTSRVLEVILPDFRGELKDALKSGSLPKAHREEKFRTIEIDKKKQTPIDTDSDD